MLPGTRRRSVAYGNQNLGDLGKRMPELQQTLGNIQEGYVHKQGLSWRSDLVCNPSHMTIRARIKDYKM